MSFYELFKIMAFVYFVFSSLQLRTKLVEAIEEPKQMKILRQGPPYTGDF